LKKEKKKSKVEITWNCDRKGTDSSFFMLAEPSPEIRNTKQERHH